MRKRTTDSRGWTTSRRRRITFSARAILLLFVLSTMGGLFTSATPHSAAADELSDAYAKQKALQKLIQDEVDNCTKTGRLTGTVVVTSGYTIAS